jgi:hypothetical protein
MECKEFLGGGVNRLKGEYFRQDFNNINSKLLQRQVFIEIMIRYEECINDMLGSHDVIATFTLSVDIKKKVSTSEAIKQGVGLI